MILKSIPSEFSTTVKTNMRNWKKASLNASNEALKELEDEKKKRIELIKFKEEHQPEIDQLVKNNLFFINIFFSPKN